MQAAQFGHWGECGIGWERTESLFYSADISQHHSLCLSPVRSALQYSGATGVMADLQKTDLRAQTAREAVIWIKVY